MNGKEKCNLLRQIRKEIAEKNGIPYETTECTYQGNDCLGTCPKCDEEIAYLDAELNKKAINGAQMDYRTSFVDVEEQGKDFLTDEEAERIIEDVNVLLDEMKRSIDEMKRNIDEIEEIEVNRQRDMRPLAGEFLPNIQAIDPLERLWQEEFEENPKDD